MAKYTEGHDERQGIIAAEKLAALAGERPVWIHAVSVGEVQAAVPFVKAAREDGWRGKFVLSTTTQTGKAMAERLGGGLYDIHIYYPWDRKLFVSRALDSLKPRIFLTAETELWPNMLWECRERSIPSFLINGRVSDRTWSRVSGGLARGAARGAYSLFTALFLRDEEDRSRLTGIGVDKDKLLVMGDSKIDALLARKNEAARDGWRERLGEPERPIFVAGSTHTGEDEKVLAAFELLRGKAPRARLIIAPRHPERAEAVAALVPRKYRVERLSSLTGGWDVLIIDRIGVLFDIYGCARSAFVGGSFADKGGQNILEPFSWGIPLQYGPHMEDFAQASRAFIAMGAASQAADERELAEVWISLAGEKDDGELWRRLSREYFEKSRGASARTWKIIKRYL
ncbi:MAG: glycosyltransferase N-terminal domain-containing protein [Synergistaceae bacterium]|nr:glycosyltransferase N-terminal domain-containing protein [Synergistaceae bacterium]